MYFKGLVSRALIYSTFLSRGEGCGAVWMREGWKKAKEPPQAGRRARCLSEGRGGHCVHGESSVGKKPGELATD